MNRKDRRRQARHAPPRSQAPESSAARPVAPSPGGNVVYSGVSGIEWPSILVGERAEALALQFQLLQTEWWSPERLRAHQFAQLGQLVRHAGETVPYYRALFHQIGFDHRALLDETSWARIPILTRFNIQDSAADLSSEQVPASHGPIAKYGTSGSTGAPIKVLKSRLQQQMWEACTLRDHLWHRRDLSGRHATIVTIHPITDGLYPHGKTVVDWGPAVRSFRTGPGFLLNVSANLEQQVEWLGRVRPDYLNSFPSNLEALAHHCADRGHVMPWLRGLRTSSEVLHPRIRELCRRVFALEIADMYSAAEVGYIALQAPETGELLVQAEANFVEVVDDEGHPCQPGQVGRVVVTPLHAFAMPLLRYASGDLAELGGPASCGRGLPVLKRVLGRERHMMRLPNGETFYPIDLTSIFSGLDAIRQFQIVRTAEGRIETRLATRAPLSQEQEDRIRHTIQERFRYPFEVRFVYFDVIPREPSGKYFDFKSEVG